MIYGFPVKEIPEFLYGHSQCHKTDMVYFLFVKLMGVKVFNEMRVRQLKGRSCGGNEVLPVVYKVIEQLVGVTFPCL